MADRAWKKSPKDYKPMSEATRKRKEQELLDKNLEMVHGVKFINSYRKLIQDSGLLKAGHWGENFEVTDSQELARELLRLMLWVRGENAGPLVPYSLSWHEEEERRKAKEYRAHAEDVKKLIKKLHTIKDTAYQLTLTYVHSIDWHRPSDAKNFEVEKTTKPRANVFLDVSLMLVKFADEAIRELELLKQTYSKEGRQPKQFRKVMIKRFVELLRSKRCANGKRLAYEAIFDRLANFFSLWTEWGESITWETIRDIYWSKKKSAHT